MGGVRAEAVPTFTETHPSEVDVSAVTHTSEGTFVYVIVN